MNKAGQYNMLDCEMSYTKDFEMFENEDFIHFLIRLTIRKCAYVLCTVLFCVP